MGAGGERVDFAISGEELATNTRIVGPKARFYGCKNNI